MPAILGDGGGVPETLQSFLQTFLSVAQGRRMLGFSLTPPMESFLKFHGVDLPLTIERPGATGIMRWRSATPMLAYNLNCWLMLFSREEGEKVDHFRHVKLCTARLRFLFVAAKIWRHAGRVGVSYSDHYEEKGIFQRLMDRLQAITRSVQGFKPVIRVAFRY